MKPHSCYVELRIGASSADIRYPIPVTSTGPGREVGFDRVLTASVTQTLRVPLTDVS